MLKTKKIKPLFTALITTADKYTKDELNGIIIDASKLEGAYKEYQKVLAVGTTVRDIKVGDIVCINPTRFAVKKHREGSMNDGVIQDNPIIDYVFDFVDFDGKECFLLQDRDIKFIVEEFEEDPPQSTIIKPNKEIIL